jgi:hypothetical protein
MGMMGNCMGAMNPMTGSGAELLIFLTALLLIWLLTLAMLGTLVFWSIRRLSGRFG